MNEGKRRVILNKVFPNASYMTQLGNLGHEIVNLFKEDSGKFYIHLNPNGTYSDEEKVDVLNISKAGKGFYQIISKAVECEVVPSAQITGRKKGEERYKQQEKKLKYGGEYIEKYFEQNVTMQGSLEKDLFVTFKCRGGIYEPKESIYIAFGESNLTENKPKLYKLEKNWGSMPCRRYINDLDDANKLAEIIDDSSLWKDSPIGTFADRKEIFEQKSTSTEENCFSFLGVEKQELQYSNALTKILQFKKDYLEAFLEGLLNKNSCKNNSFEILREEENIDILFRDLNKTSGKIIIIENKIDAGVTLSDSIAERLETQIEKYFFKLEKCDKNKLSEKQTEALDDIKNIVGSIGKPSQLSKYYIIAVYWALKNGWDEDKIKNDIYCYFLCPEYYKCNYPTDNNGSLKIDDLALSEKYQLITYKDILKIFYKFARDGLTDHQKFLLEGFISAISMFAKERDDSMELKMIRLFIERYEKIKEGQR